MRRTLLVAPLLALMVHTAGRADDADAGQQVATLSKQHREAAVKGDTNTLESILADDWIGIDPNGGAEDKALAAKNLRDGTIDYEAIDPLEEVKVRVYGDAAVVTGRYQAKLTYKGQKIDSLVRTTEFYAKQGGTWRCVHTQVTRIAGQSGEKR